MLVLASCRSVFLKVIIVLLCLFPALSISSPSWAQTYRAEAAHWNPEEREAVKVVQSWVTGWSQKDLGKIAVKMSQDCEYRLDPSRPAKYGRDAFIADARPLLPAMLSMKVLEIHVIGSQVNVAVLIKRVDSFVLHGKTRAIPVATLFRVQGDHIVQLLDIPLIDLGADASGPSTTAN